MSSVHVLYVPKGMFRKVNYFAYIFTFRRRIAQGARQPRQFDRSPPWRQQVPRRVVLKMMAMATYACQTSDSGNETCEHKFEVFHQLGPFAMSFTNT